MTYDEAGIQAVAIQARDALVAAEKTESQAELSAPDASARFGAAGGARRCIQQSGLPTDDPRDVLIRLIQAKFQDTPAYICRPRRGVGRLERRLPHPAHGLPAGHPGLSPREDSSAYS